MYLVRSKNYLFQVECKKAQPKEVMLPANLAKTRAAGPRGLGELVMVSPHGSGMLQTLRYSPYSVPSTNTAMVALSQQQPLAIANHSTAAGTSPMAALTAQLAAAAASGNTQAAAQQTAASHGFNPASQFPQLQLIGLDSNGQLSSLSQLLSAAAASGQFSGNAASHHGCKVPTSLSSVPTTGASAFGYSSNPFSTLVQAASGCHQGGVGAGGGLQGGHQTSLATQHHHQHQQMHQPPNLGYNVSDLLNLQGLQGLQVPVGL